MKFGIFKAFLKYFGKTYYVHIPFGLLVVNFIFQRIFRINTDVPFSVNYTNRISGYKYIKIDESSMVSFTVSGGAYIVAHEKAEISIGKNVIFANNCCIQTINHGYIDRNNFTYAAVHIGDNCWLGNSVSILAGVSLGENVTVGANSVVTKSFPSNVVIAGVPAKIIKTIS